MNCVTQLARLAVRGLAVLVEMAGVDPHDVGLGAVLGAARAVQIELLLERDVRQERRHRDAPAALGGERVGAVGGSAQVDAVLAIDERHDMRVGHVEIGALVREPLVLERLQEQVDGLLVARARVLVEGLAGRQRQPAVSAADAPFVASAGEDVGRVDDAGQHGRVVVRQGMQHGAEADVPGPLCRRGEQRRRVRRYRELREEEVLDRRVDVVAQAIGVLHLFEHLAVQLLGRLTRVQLELGVQAEPHRGDSLSWMNEGQRQAGYVSARR